MQRTMENAQRKPFIVGNWKMHGMDADLETVAQIADCADRYASAVTVALALPATLVHRAATLCARTRLIIGGQDCHSAERGAYTGDCSAAMLGDAGARLVIVGHSERRAMHGESSDRVRRKAEAAQAAGLDSILCVGEPEEARSAGHASSYVRTQLSESLPENIDLEHMVMAYEPIWAVGSGRTPTPAEISAVHEVMMQTATEYAAGGASPVVLYGGSVTAASAAAILAAPGVGGVLVGGASLNAQSFGDIIAVAAAASRRA